MPYSIPRDTDLWVCRGIKLSNYKFTFPNPEPVRQNNGTVQVLTVFPFGKGSPLRELCERIRRDGITSYSESFPANVEGTRQAGPALDMAHALTHQINSFSAKYQGYVLPCTTLLDAQLHGMPVFCRGNTEKTIGESKTLSRALLEGNEYGNGHYFLLQGHNPHLVQPTVPPVPVGIWTISVGSGVTAVGILERTFQFAFCFGGRKTDNMSFGYFSLMESDILAALNSMKTNPYFGRRLKMAFPLKRVTHYTPGVELENEHSITPKIAPNATQTATTTVTVT